MRYYTSRNFPILILLFTILGCANRIHIDKDSQGVHYDSIRIVLENIFDRDQGIRQIMHDSAEIDPNGNSKYISQMISIDQENLSILIPILEKYGWIPQSKIGEKASSAMFYVIQHSNIEMMDKYYPQISSLTKIGEANKEQAAMMEDRLLMWKGKKQKYGSQATTNLRIDKSLVIWPISQPDKVDSLRTLVGFELSVQENADRLGAIYNPNEELLLK